MKNLRFAVAAVLALSASSAFAGSLTTPTPGSGSPSDLFLVAFNQTTGKTEVVDLGVGASALTNGQTFNVDPNLVANLGAGVNNYLIVGGDTSYSTANLLGFDGNTIYTSSSNLTTLSWNGTTVNQGIAALQTWFTSAYVSSATPWSVIGTGANAYNTFVGGGTAQTGNWGVVTAQVGYPGNNLNLTGLIASAAIGTAINMYSVAVTQTGADVGNDPTTITKLGSFTLNGSTLSFSNVPVPAALWLLASGVLGLGAAGRRRKLAA